MLILREFQNRKHEIITEELKEILSKYEELNVYLIFLYLENKYKIYYVSPKEFFNEFDAVIKHRRNIHSKKTKEYEQKYLNEKRINKTKSIAEILTSKKVNFTRLN